MDLLSVLRTLGGLGVVLGILAGSLWLVRRFDLRLPGRTVGARERRLELIETLPIDGRRMVALVRRDGREHLVLIAPEGHLILENAIMPDDADKAADLARRAARAEAALVVDEQRQQQRARQVEATALAVDSFSNLVDRVITRAEPGRRGLRHVVRDAARLTMRLQKRGSDAVVTAKAVMARAPTGAVAATTMTDPLLFIQPTLAQPIAAVSPRSSARPPSASTGSLRKRARKHRQARRETHVA